MKFSIVIITYNRHKELYDCLKSIEHSTCPYPFEVIVIFNGDRTYFEKCVQTFKSFKFFMIHKTTPASARNLALLKVTGEYTFFLDDDCTVPQDYFTKLDFSKNWDVLGGPDQTPPHSTSFQKITGKALSSALCMGPTRNRHSSKNKSSEDADEKSLILCNLWVRSSIFKMENYKFNPDLFRNEENFLLKELKLANKKLHYSPHLFVFHNRKNNLETLGTAIVKSGECRIQNFSLLPTSKEFIYFLPLVWFIGLIAMILAPYSLIAILYLSFAIIVALQFFIIYHSFSFLYIFLHFFILVMYSIGMIKGFWKFLPTLYTSLRENKSLISESKSK